MTEITEALQTVISILGNSSTGIGTSGYEITDDDSVGLTISNGDILVTATLSKEELKDQFGGSQDYDVVIVVKSEKVEDEWIGLSTKQYTEYVMIEVNVIDKWSAVDTKFITADLVRAKATNAIRKFIKANTNSPGGTIVIWKLTGYDYEEDTNTRPIIWKAIMRTEAWMYYNPDEVTCATGERVSNGGFESQDFSGWTNDRWNVDTNPGTPPEGSYCARGTVLNSYIKHILNIFVSCFSGDSTLSFEAYARGNACTLLTNTITCTLTFDNGFTIDTDAELTSGWDSYSLVQSILDAVTSEDIAITDRLIEIKFTLTSLDGTDNEVGIDDVSIIAEG